MNTKANPKQLARIRALVASDPEIMRGAPVFEATRIPVDLVADMLAEGATATEILAGQPTLTEEMLRLATLDMGAGAWAPRQDAGAGHPHRASYSGLRTAARPPQRQLFRRTVTLQGDGLPRK
jgi:uncharacterized protein (DUF433 family)